MTTKSVRGEVIWAVLAMESALALPIMAVISTGEGAARVAMLVLLVLLLPAGYVLVRRFKSLRDPAWRVLTGFLLVVALRVTAPLAPGDGAAAAMGRFLQALVPASLAFTVWWRGGSFADAELTAADLQFEFMLGGCGLLLMLLVFHGLFAVDPQVLVWAAGLFTASGLTALVLARQDAADASAQRGARVLGMLVALLPIGVAVALLIVLRPDVLAAGWLALAHLIELVLMPILLLISFLASLLPMGSPGVVQPPPTQLQPPPNLDALARQQAPPEWIPWLALTLVLLLVLFMVAGILRLLLETEVVVHPTTPRTNDSNALTSEPTGGAGQDARQLLRWLAALFRRRFGRSRGLASASRPLAPDDAWAAYRALLQWGVEHGVRRQPSETTGQLEARLLSLQPDASQVVHTVTTTYEDERYGSHQPARALLQRIHAAISSLRQ